MQWNILNPQHVAPWRIGARARGVTRGRCVPSPRHLVPTASRLSRPLPVPGPVNPLGGPYHDSTYSLPNPYHNPQPPSHVEDERPDATLCGWTLLQKGFCDLLGLIPTPSPPRFL
jgi:hypothetical protein